MAQFFFHYHTPGETSRDDLGCSFETLELAYLDAHRSMIEIGCELLKDHQNPSGHWIEIADADGRSLMTLHFDEVFRGNRRLPNISAEAEIFRARVERFRRLRDDMNEACMVARASLDQAHEVLRRAKAVA